MTVAFPGESAEYRAARNRLLEQEIELRRATDTVAAARRLGHRVTGEHARQPRTRQLAATLDKLARRELNRLSGARRASRSGT